ncbi:endonuclease [bacterium]|nr:endonuclease [bacterium]
MTCGLRLFLGILGGILGVQCGLSCAAQTESPPCAKRIRVAFYNAENLFDAQDDSLTQDEEFLPEGAKHWTQGRMREKQRNIARILLAMSCSDEPPALFGLCELENRAVLEGIAYSELLTNYTYKAVHFDSPDARGIDVGLLYRPERLRLLYAARLPVTDPTQPEWKTRDILYAKFAVAQQADTLHVFVNHWPSRRGGEEASRPYRMRAAQRLRHAFDSIRSADPWDAIVAMGDLNDGPGDPSLREGLGTLEDPCSPRDWNGTEIVDLMECAEPGLGTHKYGGHWEYLDHMIVNGTLFSPPFRSLGLGPDGVQVVRFDWLLTPDERFTGQKPLRTYEGLRYTGGYSDHLPLYLDLWMRGATNQSGAKTN